MAAVRAPRPRPLPSLLALLAAAAAAAAAADSSNLTVVLLGDSLINRPCEMFNLTERLVNMTEPAPGTSLRFVNAGNNGEEIASIEARTAAVLAANAPVWAVILFWDSDCSNVDESKLSPQEVAQLRANYSANLIATERMILAITPRLAVAGPELLGEGPLGLPARFANKTQMLEDYVCLRRSRGPPRPSSTNPNHKPVWTAPRTAPRRPTYSYPTQRALTRAAASAEDVPYIDMRAAFMAEIPPWRVCRSKRVLARARTRMRASALTCLPSFAGG
jgi:hypothetical protein